MIPFRCTLCNGLKTTAQWFCRRYNKFFFCSYCYNLHADVIDTKILQTKSSTFAL